jgi:hypothetical protein
MTKIHRKTLQNVGEKKKKKLERMRWKIELIAIHHA